MGVRSIQCPVKRSIGVEPTAPKLYRLPGQGWLKSNRRAGGRVPAI